MAPSNRLVIQSSNRRLGENITIFEQDGIEVSGESIGKQWYDECQNYNFDNPCWQKGTSNFTQIVWRGSTEVGVAMVRMKRSDTKAVAVAFFRPPGNTNFHGNYRDNVLPPQPCAEL
ncbi:PREDICTED: Golgi-associated plant pathogenesis-related protein 1-like [Priapulus caudatus]|uniref:Golgi-associated plant pathogenesis-related protein 1-like n=1 Tax=Priapulus caudatus TaxID=37621 RepID=A0ABM1DNV9_PRICU|nr:PREDICTED: Golgi-associated plant pathogenesis-related protein 1-like [Priapulus caudatus]